MCHTQRIPHLHAHGLLFPYSSTCIHAHRRWHSGTPSPNSKNMKKPLGESSYSCGRPHHLHTIIHIHTIYNWLTQYPLAWLELQLFMYMYTYSWHPFSSIRIACILHTGSLVVSVTLYTHVQCDPSNVLSLRICVSRNTLLLGHWKWSNIRLTIITQAIQYLHVYSNSATITTAYMEYIYIQASITR